MEENNMYEAEVIDSKDNEAEKKQSRNWNIFIGIATAVGVFMFGLLGALLGCLGGFLTKLIWTKTSLSTPVKVVIVAVIWVILIVFYITIVGALALIS